MNKDTDKLELLNHSISITERQNIQISGITKIDSFDNEEFLLETSAGPLGIKGKDLEIIKLDTYEGTIMIKGIVDAFSYFDTGKSKKENSIITKLFK
jgi:sporulation protein YabP